MVFYFTGTGNSLWVAKRLAEVFDEPLIPIAGALKKQTDELIYDLDDNENVFFVYPVHSWGPALPVMQFIARFRFQNYHHQPVYSVVTCGDECGYTNDIFSKALSKKGITLSAGYSVEMPNNYILLPGFNVDSKEVEYNKLNKAPDTLNNIVSSIKGEPADIYLQGSLPFIKSRMIYPLFGSYAARQAGKFYATDDCIACNLCAKICPTHTISIREDGKPEWDRKSCVQCTACIHYCPVRAIEFGKVSVNKGRYHHPEINQRELSGK